MAVMVDVMGMVATDAAAYTCRRQSGQGLPANRSASVMQLMDVRMWRGAGVYNEQVFKGVDYAIAQAARFGIKIIVALTTYWEDNDGLGNVSVTPSLHMMRCMCMQPALSLDQRRSVRPAIACDDAR